MKKLVLAVGITLLDGVRYVGMLIGVMLLLFCTTGGTWHMIAVGGSMLLGEEQSFISELDRLGNTALFYEKVLFTVEIASWTLFLLVLLVASVRCNINRAESTAN